MEMTTTTPDAKHRHFEKAERAHYNLSFSPDKRAKHLTQEFDKILDIVKKILDDVNYPEDRTKQFMDRVENKFLAWLSALGDTASPMITGPAKFPVRRMEKRRATADKRCSEYYDSIELAKRIAHRYKRHQDKLHGPSELEKQTDKLARLEQWHAIMVAANKLHRANKATPENLIAAGVPQDKVELVQGMLPFEQYMLTNSKGRIKHTKEMLAKLQRFEQLQAKDEAAGNSRELQGEGMTLRANLELQRFQVIYPGKPDRDTIAKLKKNGFKWAPSQSAWQRQITGNAVYACCTVTGIDYDQVKSLLK